MKTRGGKVALPGQYMIVGRKDDTDQVVFSIVSDIPANPRITTLCRRALYEMGINDPMTYEFLVMLCVLPNGGAQIALDQTALRRYVHANYGS